MTGICCVQTAHERKKVEESEAAGWEKGSRAITNMVKNTFIYLFFKCLFLVMSYTIDQMNTLNTEFKHTCLKGYLLALQR